MALLTKILWIYLLLMTVVAFGVCGWDKRAAQRQLRRVPEKTLFLLAGLGGSLGLYAGMLTFRHKTQHWSFRLGIPAIVLAQGVLLLLLYRLLNPGA